LETPIVYIASQKGGVGRSSTANSLAIEYTNSGWNPVVADLDTGQHSSFAFCQRRLESGIEPEIETIKYPTARSALNARGLGNILIIDGAVKSSKDTPIIAAQSNLVIIPTGPSVDDIEPALDLASNLIADTNLSLENFMFIITKLPLGAEGHGDLARNTIMKYGWYCSPHYVRLMRGYINALDKGKGLTETTHTGLNREAGNQIQDIVERIGKVTNGS
jgi:chromosome partitioning protein